MKKCLVCKSLVIKNTYHRAIKAGAIWYCPKCDISIDKKLRPVLMRCDCCGWNNRTEAIGYASKMVFEHYYKTNKAVKFGTITQNPK